MYFVFSLIFQLAEVAFGKKTTPSKHHRAPPFASHVRRGNKMALTGLSVVGDGKPRKMVAKEGIWFDGGRGVVMFYVVNGGG